MKSEPKRRGTYFSAKSVKILEDIIKREKIKNVNRAINIILGRYERFSLTRDVIIKKINRAIKEFDISVYDLFPNFKPKTRKSIKESVRHQVFKRDSYRCVECGATNCGSVLHIDHIIPISRGGTDNIKNLQVLCEKCNCSKSIQIWLEAMDDRKEPE